MAYATKGAPPRTLTDVEVELLLKVTGEHRAGYRDHVFYSVALGTALREHELLALNLGEVYTDLETGGVRRRVQLRVFKTSNKDADAQEVFLPDACQYKLRRFFAWKRQQGEALDAQAPLFVSRLHRRLSARMVRHAFHEWQTRAGFQRQFSVHALRHTALTRLQRETGDIRLTQRVARHASITSTQIYTEPSDEDVLRAIRPLKC